MQKMRPRPTPKILFFAVLDVIGMVVFATGAVWLCLGQPLFVRSFPASTFEAALATTAGIALMLWSVAQILREQLGKPLEKTNNEA